MKRFSEQFQTKAMKTKLNKTEQADLRDRIVSYMEYHPLPADMRVAAAPTKKTVTQPVLTESFSLYNFPVASFFKFGGVFAAIVLIVIPFVAERAVPGDALYAVKVNFNEEVRGTLTWDSYEKVEWETVRLNRRIAEAKLLKKEGRLTDEVEAATAAAVKQHAANAKAEIETMRASDADEAAIAEIELDSTLSLQAQSFSPAIPESSMMAVAMVDAKPDLIAQALGESMVKEVQTASTTLPALSKLKARVEQHTTRVRELEQTLADQVNDKDLAEVARRIDDIERVAAEAFALPEESAEEAQHMLIDVISRAQKLIVFMTELEVRESVAIETAVPVVLTQQEKNIDRSERMVKIEGYLTQLTEAEVEDESLGEKLVLLVEQLETAYVEVKATTDYKVFVSLSDNAIALGQDAVMLLEQAGVETVEPTVPPDNATSTESVASSTATSSEPVLTPDPAEETVSSSTGSSNEATTTEPSVGIDGITELSSTTVEAQAALDVSL